MGFVSTDADEGKRTINKRHDDFLGCQIIMLESEPPEEGRPSQAQGYDGRLEGEATKIGAASR